MWFSQVQANCRILHCVPHLLGGKGARWPCWDVNYQPRQAVLIVVLRHLPVFPFPFTRKIVPVFFIPPTGTMQGVPRGRGFILDLEAAGKAKSLAHGSWSREASGQAHSTGHHSSCIVGKMSMVLPNTVFMRNLAAASTLQPLVRRDTRFVDRSACRAKTAPGGVLPGLSARVGFDSAWW